MKINYTLNITVGLVSLFMVTLGAIGQTKLPGPPREGDERLVTPLINAGIALNESSLCKALSNQDSTIAARAASALARFPKSRRIVHALETAVAADRDIVSLDAAYSLLELNEKAWVATGAARLRAMHNPLLQIQFAGLLARAGNTAGWSLITSKITDERFTPIVLENIDYFDGKIGPSGRRIKVVEELERLSGETPEGSRKLIAQKLAQLKT